MFAVACLLCIATLNVSAKTTILIDNFDTDHQYYDGTTVNLAGTPWDGIYGTQYLTNLCANTSKAAPLRAVICL